MGGRRPGHDVAAYSCKPACHWKAEPGNASADMVRQQVTYRHDSIRITVTLRHIDPTAAFALSSILKKTERVGRYYGVIAQFSPGKTPTIVIRNPHGTPVDCGAATPKSAARSSRSSSRPAACTRRSGCAGAATCG